MSELSVTIDVLPVEPLPVTIHAWPPPVVEARYLDRLASLTEVHS